MLSAPPRHKDGCGWKQSIITDTRDWAPEGWVDKRVNFVELFVVNAASSLFLPALLCRGVAENYIFSGLSYFVWFQVRVHQWKKLLRYFAGRWRRKDQYSWEITVTRLMSRWRTFSDFPGIRMHPHFCYSLSVGRNFPRDSEIEAVSWQPFKNHML